MTIAAGGRCLSDLRTLRDQPALFGTVASDTTAWRTVHQLGEMLLGVLVGVRQAATRRLLEHAEVEQIELEVDATLLHLHSEDRHGAAATFKGGFGFAPMLCFIEPLGLPAGMLRPGGATANNAAAVIADLDEDGWGPAYDTGGVSVTARRIGLRHQVTLTNDDTAESTVIERDHRGHARVENRIKNLKDTGLSRLPFTSFDANRAWVELVQIAALLLAGLQAATA